MDSDNWVVSNLQGALDTWNEKMGEIVGLLTASPAAIDDGVARVKLETLGVKIDTLTEEQIAYMNSWNF